MNDSPAFEMMRRSAISSMVVFVMAVSPLSAQSEAPTLHELTIGLPLKVTVGDGTRTIHSGNFLGVAADTVRLLLGRDSISYPMASVRRIEVSRGRNRRLGRAYGAGIGGLAFSISYAGLMLAAGEPGYARDGTPFMLVVGAVVGSVVGSHVAPMRWEVVSFQTNPL